MLQLHLLLLLLQRRPWNARLWYFPAQPARATFGTAIHPWTSIRECTPTTTTVTATTTTVTVAINIAITPAVCGGGVGVGGVDRVGGVRRETAAGAGAGATEGDREILGRDEIEKRRLLVGLICTENRDLVQRAWGEPWFDHTPDSGKRCWRVDNDELAHTTTI